VTANACFIPTKRRIEDTYSILGANKFSGGEPPNPNKGKGKGGWEKGEGEREDGRSGRGLREGWEMGWEERGMQGERFQPPILLVTRRLW
jgi:hypothetical protein